MDTEDLVRLLLRKELYEAFGVEIGLCSRVGGKGEFSDVVLHTGGFEILFCLAHPGNLGVGVDDGRYGVVVDMSVTVLDVLHGSDTWAAS